MSRRPAWLSLWLARWGAALILLAVATHAHAAVLDPLTLIKYVDPLPVPGAMPMAGPNHYEIGAWQIQQQLHSELPPTTVYGYGASQATASYPGATIVAQKGVPITIRWTNNLPSPHILEYAFDPTIPKAHTTTGIPITAHVHGAEVEPQSDGGPYTWFTPGFAETGHDWQHEVYNYANDQLPATIWYHDHAFGYTRHNVYAGLAGFYVITDPGNEPVGLPSGPYDIGLAIQDKMFTDDGQLWYPNVGLGETHPVWIPEFFGDVILVNGKVWPYLEVEPRKYRFRMLNGANARFFSLALTDGLSGKAGPAFHQIATDGGYLAAPVVLNDPRDQHSGRLVIAPGERAEIIVDFSGYQPGDELILRNNAKAPFPNGETPNPQTTGQIMKFKVVELSAPDESVIPATLTTITPIGEPDVTRVMTLNEHMEDDVPVGAFLNGMPFHDAPATEYPTLGSTEEWAIVNMTGDTHPIHLHLVQFQILDRHKFHVRRYEEAFEQANPELPADSYVPVPVEPFYRGKPIPPDPNEMGWKDTFRMNPAEVTCVRIRFARQDDAPAFDFDATAEPGYVWHCHILEHEENDMMRPYYLVSPVAQGEGGSTVVPPGGDAPAGALTAEGGFVSLGPNPSAAGGSFRFTLRAESAVALELFNAAGQRVRTLADGTMGAGAHEVRWDGRGDDGRTVSPGVYFINLRADGMSQTRKLIVSQ